MVQRLNALTTAVYVRGVVLTQRIKNGGARLASELKEDERGLSGVVVAVMLIVIAVLLIIALWGSLSDLVGDMWKKIAGAEGKFTQQDSLDGFGTN